MKQLGIQNSMDAAEGVQDEIKITFEANAVAFYAQVSGLAKDKISYPIRELCTNAWDASKGDFTVTLPTQINPTFSVRDRGPGMSPSAMKDVYARLYASTKRATSEEVGGWGLGSKSPFAYLLGESGTGSYTVTSYHEGMMQMYTMSIDRSGEPVLRLMFEAESDEPSGLEVSFAVRRDDIHAFTNKARRILWGFTPRPEIIPSMDYGDPVVLAEGEGWTRYRAGSVPFTGPHVRMGPVMYPIDMSQIDHSGYLEEADCVLLDTPIGSVSVTLSRESLSFDENTKANIEALVKRYEANETNLIYDRIASQASLLDASATFEEETAMMSRNKRDRLRQMVKWQDRDLIYVITSGDGAARYMLLPKDWTTFDQFSQGKVAAHKMKGLLVVVEHNAYRSLERFQSAGLAGRAILWVRVKRKDLPYALEFLGNPEYVTLDDTKLKGLTPKDPGRPKTMRRKRVLFLGKDSIRGSIDVDDVDMAVPGYAIRRIRAYRSHYSNFTLSDLNEDRALLGSENTVSDVIAKARALEILDPNIEEFLILSQDDDLPEGWQMIGDGLVAKAKALVDMTTLDPLHGIGIYSIPDYVRNFDGRSSGRDVVRPQDIQHLVDDINALIFRLSNKAESNNTTVKAIALLASMGHSTPISADTSEIDKIVDRYSLINRKYPILSFFFNQYGYGNRHLIKTVIDEYYRILEENEKMKEQLMAYGVSFQDAEETAVSYDAPE